MLNVLFDGCPAPEHARDGRRPAGRRAPRLSGEHDRDTHRAILNFASSDAYAYRVLRLLLPAVGRTCMGVLVERRGGGRPKAANPCKESPLAPLVALIPASERSRLVTAAGCVGRGALRSCRAPFTSPDAVMSRAGAASRQCTLDSASVSDRLRGRWRVTRCRPTRQI